ncbi:hypothetical protein Tco_1414700 [Tanacetum coccineum]
MQGPEFAVTNGVLLVISAIMVGNTATRHHRRGCTDNHLDHTPNSSSTATTAPKTASAKRSLLPDLSLDASLDTVW